MQGSSGAGSRTIEGHAIREKFQRECRDPGRRLPPRPSDVICRPSWCLSLRTPRERRGERPRPTSFEEDDEQLQAQTREARLKTPHDSRRARTLQDHGVGHRRGIAPPAKAWVVNASQLGRLVSEQAKPATAAREQITVMADQSRTILDRLHAAAAVPVVPAMASGRLDMNTATSMAQLTVPPSRSPRR